MQIKNQRLRAIRRKKAIKEISDLMKTEVQQKYLTNMVAIKDIKLIE